MQTALCSLIGYIIGSINAAYIISRLNGFDIRQRGTGNAGASNVMMTLGKKAGLLTALFDIFKAVAASLIAYHLFPSLSCAKIIAGSSCVLGHIFPVFMRFRGGKGLACLAGMIAAFDLRLFLFLLITELFIAIVLDYICVIPMTSSVIFTFIYALTTGDPLGTSILSVICIIVMLKHIENLRRIQNGTEAHISFLWHKDKEKERINNNSTAD